MTDSIVDLLQPKSVHFHVSQGGSGGGGGGATLIQSITDPVDGIFDFDGISGTYTKLFLRGWIRSTAVATAEYAQIYVNESGEPANYRAAVQQVFNGNNSVAQTSVPSMAYITAASSPAGNYTDIDAFIAGPFDTVKKKIITTLYSSQHQLGVTTSGRCSTFSPVTDAIVRLRVQSVAATTNDLIGTLALYGE